MKSNSLRNAVNTARQRFSRSATTAATQSTASPSLPAASGRPDSPPAGTRPESSTGLTRPNRTNSATSSAAEVPPRKRSPLKVLRDVRDRAMNAVRTTSTTSASHSSSPRISTASATGRTSLLGVGGSRPVGMDVASPFTGHQVAEMSTSAAGKPPGLGGVLPIPERPRVAQPAPGSSTDPAHNQAVSDFLLQEMQDKMKADGYLGAPNISTKVKWADMRDDGTVRARNAQAAIDDIHELEHPTKEAQFETDPDKLGEKAWNANAHRCGEAAMAVAYRAKQLGFEAHVRGADPHHGFAVVGKLDKDTVLKAPISEWPSHLRICDPWSGLSCSPQEYEGQLTDRMQTLEEQGMVVNTGTKFEPPVSGGWLKNTLTAEYTGL